MHAAAIKVTATIKVSVLPRVLIRPIMEGSVNPATGRNAPGSGIEDECDASRVKRGA